MSLAFDPQMQLPSSVLQAKESESQDRKEGWKQVGQQFEALFIQTMFEQMRNTVPEDGILGDSFSSDLYEEMLDKQVAREAAREMDLGLARSLYEDYSPSREGESSAQGGSASLGKG